jgi:hypothetical protein
VLLTRWCACTLRGGSPGIGAFYGDFLQTSDDEVRRLLTKAPPEVAAAHAAGPDDPAREVDVTADGLRLTGLATLLFDLLTPVEALDRANVFDTVLLADRLVGATHWLREQPETAGLPGCPSATSAPAPGRRPRWGPPPSSATTSQRSCPAAVDPTARDPASPR